jgi:hypothetical protein
MIRERVGIGAAQMVCMSVSMMPGASEQTRAPFACELSSSARQRVVVIHAGLRCAVQRLRCHRAAAIAGRNVERLLADQPAVARRNAAVSCIGASSPTRSTLAMSALLASASGAMRGSAAALLINVTDA